MSAANPVTVPLATYQARHLRVAVDRKVATLTLDRPDKKNPLTFDSYAELADLFRAAAKEKAVKAAPKPKDKVAAIATPTDEAVEKVADKLKDAKV